MPDQIYDKSYKTLLSKKRNFLMMLRSFVNKKWVDKIKESSLIRVDTEFVLPDFTKRIADNIYRAEFEDSVFYFYILNELQSTPDFTMPLRFLSLSTELFKLEFLNTPKNIRESEGYRLPIIVPILLYNGEFRWNVVRSFKEYQRGNELFGKEIIDFSYIVIDINRIDDSKLSKISNLISTVFFLDKKISYKDKKWGKRLHSAFEAYSKFTDEEKQDFIGWFENVFVKKVKGLDDSSKLTDMFIEGDVDKMTYAIDRAFEECREDGIKEGIEKGIEKGIERAKEEFVYNMLIEGFDTNVVAKVSRLSIEDVAELKETLRTEGRLI